MYESFYGFKEKPFSMLPDPSFLFLSKKHQTALTLLEYGLFNQVGFCVISGEPGAGKTTVLRAMLERVGKNVTVGLITNTHQSFGGLLDWILSVYDLHKPGLTKVEMHQIFMDYLIDEYSKNRTVLLIVDEAQNMNADSLEELRMLSNVNSEKDQLLQVVLVGQPALKDILRKPELMQFAQRIAVDYHLASLDLEETCGYIQHRLVTAGAKKDVFTPAACERIYNYSGGTPRLINLLCETVLVFGFADQVDMIDVDLVEEMVHERMKDSVVPFNNKDVARTKDAKAIKKLEENFPWIGNGDEEPESAEDSPAESEANADEPLLTVNETSISDSENKSQEDLAAIKAKENDQLAGSAIKKTDESSLPIDDGDSKNVDKSNLPETSSSVAKTNAATSNIYKYGAVAVILVLIIIIGILLFGNKGSTISVETGSEFLKQQEAKNLHAAETQRIIEEEELAREAAITLAIEEAAVKEKLNKELAERDRLKKEQAKKDEAAIAAKKKQEKELAKKKRDEQKRADKKRAEKKRAEKERLTKERLAKEQERKAVLLEKENRLKAEQETIRLERERLAAEKEAYAAKVAASEKQIQKNKNIAEQASKQSDGWIDERTTPVKKKTVGCSGPTARFKSHCR